MIVDVHAHLDFDQFNSDLDSVIERAKQVGVKVIINNGVDIATNRKSLELAEKYNIVKVALGFYPIEALEAGMDAVKKEIEFIRSVKNKIVAIGEIGIDLKNNSDLNGQKEVFELFLDLAKELDLPVIVHSRQAEKEVVEILENKKMKKVIMHCFHGSLELVLRCEKNGWYFSIPPVILRSLTFQQLVSNVSADQLLTETDSPFLAPPPKQRNEPSFIVYTINKIAELKNLDEEEVKNILFRNFQTLFSK